MITVHVECKTGLNEIPEGLEDVIKEDTEYREADIREDQIQCYYKQHDPDHSIIDHINLPVITQRLR